ncbi:2-succinyl-5-enolpyruvyl-6-hydroxy-3-cyclohexene-1-carboxylic-acid synthase [Hymenobacter defluvii]|uniref:2-succinyl-5-enolpyruvyl-6-hydroxy-3-cyclohexene-1-carboxylate synthase n=1 Tax=Hymenobacter defluvii TaxID=2054411 RepID=A0ABS3T6E0_9BACT|nr:2-succinyl-5-enolpyruvyl-6-hydroxy-3-cyclohexene-1-carboxylic-acid synthase [Hymenobacter defluvii]MBO3269212.1 2-succinyl-5-enolpyruvyl-6-hydroxy-3-cyclohexene-1-carboxylic-acid synthase [Hymenobacter defluvii]
MSLQAIHNIPEICAQLGITDAVLSPGSRCAPLTIAFARHPGVQVRTVPDERAAAFIGLGIAQAQRRAVALVCTSGTAGLNYAPAVAEAYFQQIPLVVFTADRPPEWIDQLDGQTIRQTDLYGAHAKGSFTLPVDISHPDAEWHAARIVNEAMNLAQRAPAGPVQVNVPLREPFYPKAGEELTFGPMKVIREEMSAPVLLPSQAAALRDTIRDAARVLVVAGQHPWEPALQQALHQFSIAFDVPVVGDTIANLPSAIGQQDVFLAAQNQTLRESLRPTLLITFGQSLISKALKLYLRNTPIAQHWHIQAAGEVADTYRALTQIIRVEPADFFAALTAIGNTDSIGVSEAVDSSSILGTTAMRPPFPADATRVAPPALVPISAAIETGVPSASYTAAWQRTNAQATDFLDTFFQQPNQPFNEFAAIHKALHSLPEYTVLHLANSMAVRYANIIGLPQGRAVEVFANRGTSGIDGCTSTAVGAALAQPERPVVLLTGDVAFFYDRNAFWHNYPTPNLRVVLLNNHAGGIFRLIDGPRQQPELEEFFETRQPLRAENTARDFGLRYFAVSSFAELESALPVFFAAEGGAALLEITTDSQTNAAFFEHYRNTVKAAFA